jgi:ubiquinone/menaquinone biosynthesis C-methylase UbiE
MQPEEYQVNYNLEGKYWWFLGRTKIAFSMLNRHLKNKSNLKILDAGCGTGKNLEYLQKYGKVHGLDFSNDALQFCHKRGLTNLYKGDLEDLPFEDDSFDLVTCFGVLYHQGIKDDQKAIKELARVCTPRGLILITTPAGPFLTNKLFSSQHDVSQQTGRRHSKKQLINLQQQANLDVLEISYMNTFLMPLVVLMRLLKKLIPQKSDFRSELQLPSKGINKFLYSILKLENRLIGKLPFGMTLVSVAKKKN